MSDRKLINSINGKKGGRIQGTKAFKTLVKEEVKEKMNQRIFGIIPSLLNAQASIARGTQYLYRIDTTYEKGPRGGTVKTRSKPKLVTNPDEIAMYIDAYDRSELEDVNSDTTYYFITAKEPDNQAIDSLLDRTLGRPKNDDAGTGGNTFNNFGTFISTPVERELDDDSAKRLGLLQ